MLCLNVVLLQDVSHIKTLSFAFTGHEPRLYTLFAVFFIRFNIFLALRENILVYTDLCSYS